MGYYKLLGLNKEPFSTSPDPSLFYPSRERKAALYRLCVAVKLKRGLSLVLGEVGTGKTTLSRQFIQTMSEDSNVEIHMVLNPLYENEVDFLRDICHRLNIPLLGEPSNLRTYFSKIEDYLFNKGLREGKDVVLIIDEAQKLTDECLEALRGLLNYETNEHKLLQVILFSQAELIPRLLRMRNLWDRVSLRHVLEPLNFIEMSEMIAYRLESCGYFSSVSLFTEEALQSIYVATSGYPRKVTQLCHDCLENLVMYDRATVDADLVDYLVSRDAHPHRFHSLLAAGKEVYGRPVGSQENDARRASV